MADAKQQLYCDEVMKFRKVLNLTSIKDSGLFYQTFIKPSVALSKWIDDKDVVLDIGSGMGVPGIPLLIHNENIHGVLVERRKKRTEFIRHVIRKLKLNAVAYDADINDLDPLKATVCVARAVSEVRLLLRMCDKHIIDGGKAVLPVPDEAVLPVVDGWCLHEDYRPKDMQRIACYIKGGKEGVGGVSRET
ncbi:16S rRNA (guanine(527)-N(7))-methyltransferase RsmG [Ghiorsea bivora]|uniref:16S rRNA (guanine(527)-N(7))-methyltransferase RsmG n=1 Tax=Ghiorsea bivora TaxID=1485545 RepID=UPI00056E8A40|nr:RsmG family class I SAM-dependent methyltransferase [Ghiorsea bivora]